VCIATNQSDAICNSVSNPNPTTKQHAVVSIQILLSHVLYCMYPKKFIRDNAFTTLRCHCHPASIQRLRGCSQAAADA